MSQSSPNLLVSEAELQELHGETVSHGLIKGDSFDAYFAAGFFEKPSQDFVSVRNPFAAEMIVAEDEHGLFVTGKLSEKLSKSAHKRDGFGFSFLRDLHQFVITESPFDDDEPLLQVNGIPL